MTPTRTPSDPPSSGDRKKRDYGSEANALIEEMQVSFSLDNSDWRW